MSQSLLFYKSPIPLDRKLHKNFKLQRQTTYEFANNSNSVPVAGLEFFQASRNYPILFVKNQNAEFIPIAVLSLKSAGHDLGENWDDVYVPAFIRRYPFILTGEGNVLFDKEAPHLQETEGEALFDDDGEPTKVLKDILGFLEQVDFGYKTTEEYCKVLAEKELLEPFKGTVKFSDTAVKLDQLYAINEKKFYELEDKDIVDWFKKGWMAWTHAHLHSLNSMGEVVKRHAQGASDKEEEPTA